MAHHGAAQISHARAAQTHTLTTSWNKHVVLLLQLRTE